MAKPTAKFRIEGEDATAAAFRAALGNAQGTANKMSGLFKAAFAGISVAAITGIASRAIEAGDELNKAAIKAGIGGKAISELAHAAKMADVDLGGLSNSLRFMQKNLSEAGTGSKVPLLALKALGLELKDIKGLAADKQFEVLADRISQLKDPADKTRAATELFGRAGADLLPMFEQGAKGIRTAREEAVKLGKSFSDEQIGKLADADDAIKRLNASWEGFATTLTAAVAPAITNVLDLLSGNAQIAARTGEMNKAEVLAVMQQALNNNRSNRQFNSAEYNAELDRQAAEIERRMRAIEQGIAGPGGRRGRVVRADKAVGFTGAVADEEAAKKAAEAAEQARIREFERSALALQQLREGELALQEGVNDALEHGNDLIADMGDIAMQELDAMNDAWLEQSRVMQEEAEERAATIKGIFDEGIFAAAKGGMDDMLDYWADTLKAMAIQAAATELFNMGGGGIGKVFSGLFGFANGGRPPVGRPSIVGERGPELFVPDGTGTIIPNHKLGGRAPNVTINVDARGAQEGVAKQLATILPAVVREAVTQSRAAVMGDLDRRGMRFA